MKKTVTDQTFNQQQSEMLRRISKLESQMNGYPIPNAKILTLTWDKSQGGFAILGGADGVSGVLQVKDADGNIIITLDENGLTYSDGETTIARFGQWEE